MIRSHILNEVHRTLDESRHFQAADFSVEAQPRKDGSGALVIRYRFDDSYTFQVDIPNTVEERSYGVIRVKIVGIVSPGTFTQREKVTYDSFSDLLGGLTSWADRIYEELLAVPVNRQLAEQKLQIEQLVAQVGDLPDEYFSREEADALRSRLDELEAQLKSNIEAASASQKEAAVQITALHNDIALLKQSAETLKKKGWVGAFMVRAKKWAGNSENRDLLKSTAVVVRTLLLGDGSKSSNS